MPARCPRTEIETPQTSVWWAAHLRLVSWRSFPRELDVAIPVDAAHEGRAHCGTTSGGTPLSDAAPTGERLGLQYESQDHLPRRRRIRPATCTSFQRTVAIVCDTHAAGQARRVKPMNKL